MDQHSDKELIAIFLDESSRNYGFNLIVRKYQEKLYWHIRRIVIDHDDAKDLLQEVFIKVWQNLIKFRADSSLYTWLYRIATNESLSFLRKQKKNLFVALENSISQASNKSSDLGGISGEEIELKLQKAVLSLPDKQRIVFNLKYFEEKKYSEIAEILGGSVGSLKASYHHAVKKVEQSLKVD